MADRRALTIQSGIFAEILDADTLIVGGSLDRGSAGVLSIGITNPTSIDIGKSGILTTVKGNFQVDGTELVVGNTTFQEDVALGNASDDLISVNGRIDTDIAFLADQDARIDIDASTAATAGHALTVAPSEGGAASGAAGGVGGALNIDAGTGGAGDGTYAGGVGGALSLTAGDAGADGGGGGANGGNVTLDAGNATGAGTDGTISIGTSNTSAITVGGGGVDVDLYNSSAGILLTAAGSSSTTSGAYTIGVYATPLSHSSNTDVQQVLEDLDSAITTSEDTLQTAYENGNTIQMTDGEGNFDVSVSSGTPSISLDAAGDSNFNVANTVAATNIKLTIGADNTGATSGDAEVEINATSTNGSGLIDINAEDTITIDSSGGSVSIDANAGSNFTVTGATLNLTTGTSGDISLAAADAMTIETANGTLELASVGGPLVLGTTQQDIDITTATSGNIDIDPASGGNFTLDTTGAGSISLDSAAASNFTVSGATADLTLGARGATITLNQSGDTTLSGFTATSIVGALNEVKAEATSLVSATAGETVAAGELLCMDDSGGNPRAFKADANGSGELQNACGWAAGAATSGNPVSIVVAGEVSVPDAETDGASGFATSDVGKRVFMSTTAGNVTVTAPSSTGDTVQKVGICSVGGSGSTKVIWQVGDGVVLG